MPAAFSSCRSPLFRHMSLALVGLAVLTVTGCRGCGSGGNTAQTAAQQAEEEAERLEEEERRREEEEERRREAPFQIEAPRVQPPDETQLTQIQMVKPGHWVTATQLMESRFDDFVGLSVTEATDARGNLWPLERTAFTLRSSRPAALTRGRPKLIESIFFVPQVDQRIFFNCELRERGSGLPVGSGGQIPIQALRPFQYKFAVLAREQERYTFLKSVDAVRVPYDGVPSDDWSDSLSGATLHYRLIQPEVFRHIPLSDNPLTWTEMAYILWDEIEPELFTAEQELALIDWLHWGGQLIISGPDSLALLKGSFLQPYLPALADESREFAAEDLAEFNRRWTISTQEKQGEPLTPTVPWSGVHLELQEGGSWVPGNTELLAESSVGRGRVVVSAMQLAERELINWSSGFESWLNACVLGRPARRYIEGAWGEETLLWADPKLDIERRLDASLITGQRYFIRDSGIDVNYREAGDSDATVRITLQNRGSARPLPTMDRRPIPPDQVGGIGAWNDYSAVAEAARTTLLEAAGVEVPQASFVVLCLALYLFVLVPLNGMFFHALGRIEWAWIAAPVIAILGTLVVVRQAQLDIGFVRAQTEIGVLELQPEHDRGHLARFTALYTSLSTTYDLEFDNLTTLAMPFTRETDPLISGQRRRPVDFERHDAVRLSGLSVTSASTELVHSEQMFPVDGTIRLGESTRGTTQVENRSALALSSVAVIHRPGEDDRLRGAWIGQLEAATSEVVSFVTLSPGGGEILFAEERATDTALLSDDERLDLENLFQLALNPATLEPGEMRLVGRHDQVLPGEVITPAASQLRGAVLVVAHLEYGPRPAPVPDLNTRTMALEEEDFESGLLNF